MNYCIYLKKRKNKPYCNYNKKEISLSHCRDCDKKEYKTKSNKIKNSEKALQSSVKILQKIRKKSKKLEKLEKNRFSVFTNNKDKCMFCPSTYKLTWHEIFAGRNRQNSMKFGLCLRMCLNCHKEKQENTNFNNFWHKQAQLYFEQNIGTREEFIKIFKRNYL